MANSRDFTGKNRKFTGTKGITVSKGTTAERVGSESGELRFNTSTDLMEYYDGTQWKPIDAPPTISGITTNDSTGSGVVLNADGSTLYTITINGGNFSTNLNVKFTGNTGTEYIAGNINRVSASQITCTTLSSMGTSDDPYDIEVTNITSSLSAALLDALTFNAPPVFVNASGVIGEVWNTRVVSGTTLDASATDAEGNTITYSIVSGSLPGSGLSISSSTGYITGTVSGTPSLGNYPFVVRAATTEGTVERQFSIQVVDVPFVAATGGTILTVGDFKTHVFTSPGTFTVTTAGAPTGSNSVEYVVIAGGGAAGPDNAGGGGGGGFRTNYPSPTTTGFPVSAQGYPITVGAGGPANPLLYGPRGSNSVFSSITSTGGGGGGQCNAAAPERDGGSGGGGSQHGTSGGSGNSPPVNPPQGNPGHPGSPNPGGGGGGGGAGQAGLSYAGEAGGKGGDGTGIPIADFFGPSSPSYGTPGPSPTLRYFAGGGGGGCGQLNNSQGGAGGVGGGGRGGGDTPGAGSGSRGDDGTANTGGGAGGTGQCPQIGVSGGSGIVIIRYKFQ